MQSLSGPSGKLGPERAAGRWGLAACIVTRTLSSLLGLEFFFKSLRLERTADPQQRRFLEVGKVCGFTPLLEQAPAPG